MEERRKTVVRPRSCGAGPLGYPPRGTSGNQPAQKKQSPAPAASNNYGLPAQDDAGRATG